MQTHRHQSSHVFFLIYVQTTEIPPSISLNPAENPMLAAKRDSVSIACILMFFFYHCKVGIYHVSDLALGWRCVLVSRVYCFEGSNFPLLY